LHKKLSIKDLVNFPIINHFDEAIGWIDERRAEKVNVLVHCHAGVSRSVSIVIAYLIRKHEWSPV
jgi:protein-tyrosine phosphatase